MSAMSGHLHRGSRGQQSRDEPCIDTPGLKLRVRQRRRMKREIAGDPVQTSRSNRALQSHEGCSTIGPVSDDLCHERVVERGHARARLDVSIDANTLACRPHYLTHYARTRTEVVSRILGVDTAL